MKIRMSSVVSIFLGAMFFCQLFACSNNKIPYPANAGSVDSNDRTAQKPPAKPNHAPHPDPSASASPKPSPSASPSAPVACATPLAPKIAENNLATGIDLHWEARIDQGFDLFQFYECKASAGLTPDVSKCTHLYTVVCDKDVCLAYTPDEFAQGTHSQGNVTIVQVDSTTVAYRFVDSLTKITSGDEIAWVPFCKSI